VLVIVPAVAGKLAVVAPAAMVIEAGAVSNGLLDERVTVRPPVGAGALAVTVQVLMAPDVREVGAQASEVTVTSGARLMEAVLELPFKAAVTTAVWALVTVPAVAVKEAVVAAAATVTLAGTVKLTLLLVKATVEPPVGAGALKVTLQALVPGPVNEAGLQVRPVTVTGGGTFTTPPVAEVAIDIAVEDAEDAFMTWIGLLRLEPEERTKLAVTTTPFGIVLAFRPLNRQVYEPFVPKQVRDLDAPVALGPAVTVIAVKSVGEYENVHSSPAGCVAAEVKERFKVTLPPAGATPDERDSDTWAEVGEIERNSRVDKNADLVNQVCRVFSTMGLLSGHNSALVRNGPMPGV